MASSRVLRHVVLLGFQDGVTREQIESVEGGFTALQGKIDAIAGFEWGTDVSVENKAAGYTHCFVVTFLDETGRDAYLIHPEHVAFAQGLRALVSQVLVIDFWSRS